MIEMPDIPAFLRRGLALPATEENEMGRPKGSKNRPKVLPDETAARAVKNGSSPGHNKPTADMTEDQRRALALQHKAAYEKALAVKKDGDAKFKNACKLIKADVGTDGVDLIKDMILAESEEGEAQLKARMERAMRAARYMSAPLGSQFEMFDGDRTPAVDRARDEGKKAGMEGAHCKPPYDTSVPQHDAWIEGWHEGQKALFAIQRTEDGEAFDEADAGEDVGAAIDQIGDAEPTYAVQ